MKKLKEIITITTTPTLKDLFEKIEQSQAKILNEIGYVRNDLNDMHDDLHDLKDD